ncbi:MAG: ATP-binding protein [Clostridia bacterium]
MENNYLELLQEAQLSLSRITVYRNIFKDEIIIAYSDLINELSSATPIVKQLLSCYHQFLSLLINAYASDKQIIGDLWENHIINLVLTDENVFSLACEKETDEEKYKGFLDIICFDLKQLHVLFKCNEKCLQNILESKTAIKTWPSYEIDYTNNIDSEMKNILFMSEDWCNEMDKLKHYYYQFGCGAFSFFKAFRWNQQNIGGSLAGIESPDPIRLSQLIGYEKERSEVITNTLQLIQGLPCNNILLYGDRGTGKSATVKALLNEYAGCKLRLVEVSKYHLKDLPHIMESLQNRGIKFIIFIDDLSFESDETSYRELKSVLEGGIEVKPQNVVIYATSNRRHLIKEYFSERSSGDEVSSQDTLQEKLSLSDRFGITITFSSPDKEKYLEIVEGLAKQRCLKIDTAELKTKALQWEMWYNGRSPRTAKQFIDHLEGELKLK